MDAEAQRGTWRGPLRGASVLLGQGMEYEIANGVHDRGENAQKIPRTGALESTSAR